MQANEHNNEPVRNYVKLLVMMNVCWIVSTLLNSNNKKDDETLDSEKLVERAKEVKKVEKAFVKLGIMKIESGDSGKDASMRLLVGVLIGCLAMEKTTIWIVMMRIVTHQEVQAN